MIIKYPDPLLRSKSLPVDLSKTSELRDIIAKLQYELRRTRDGIGLSAIQVGIPLRIFLIDVGDTRPEPDWRTYIGDNELAWREVVVNPEILESEEMSSTREESCLSIPLTYKKVSRPRQVTVAYMTPLGEKKVDILTDIHARIFQHEFDHLEGKLIIDH